MPSLLPTQDCQSAAVVIGCRRGPALNLGMSAFFVVLQILTTAGHVCLYRMSVDDQQWVGA